MASPWPGHVARICTAAAGAALLLTAPAFGQQPPPGGQGPRQHKADRAPEEAGRPAQAKTDAQREEERARLNAQLQDVARRVQEREAQLSYVEERGGELEAQLDLKRGSLAQRRASIAGLLAALQRIGRNPPPVIITRRQDALEMVRSAMLLARAHPRIQEQADKLSEELAELSRITADMKTTRQQLASESQRLKDAQTQLAVLMETKRQSLPERQPELEDLWREVRQIERSDLDRFIADLDRKVSRITGLKTYNEELKTRELRGAIDPGAKGTQVAALPPAKGPVVELSPGTSLLTSRPGRMEPAIPFHLAKAQLPLPAQGRRVLSFGETTSNGRKSQGILIQTRYSAQITAPCDGWVVYAGEFRSYGQLLIINAGAGYHVLLAGLSHIDAQLGQFVLAGEPVGTMSRAPKGKTQDSAPVLYVEFRKEGRPTDPDPWWHEGQQRVQG